MLRYRPVVRLADGVVQGIGAVVMRAPDAGPNRPLASVTGRDGATTTTGGWQVIAEHCRQLARWRDEHPERPLDATVRLTARQLVDPDLTGHIRRALDAVALAPHCLFVELHVSALADDPVATGRALGHLRQLGVRASVRGLGTAGWDPRLLRCATFDRLTVDSALVSALGTTRLDGAVVQGLASFAHALDLTVVAEEIETTQQATALRDLGVQAGHGDLWGPAVPASSLGPLLTSTPTAPGLGPSSAPREGRPAPSSELPSR